MIKKPAEMINETNKYRVLIAGYPGIGKTTLGLSAPKPLLIDVDFGINRVMASVRTVSYTHLVLAQHAPQREQNEDGQQDHDARQQRF